MLSSLSRDTGTKLQAGTVMFAVGGAAREHGGGSESVTTTNSA